MAAASPAACNGRTATCGLPFFFACKRQWAHFCGRPQGAECSRRAFQIDNKIEIFCETPATQKQV